MDFNPRSHERSDKFRAFVKNIETISIHAPTRGATELPQLGGANSQFQSTLPREERHTLSPIASEILDFNPRSHERSDSNIAQKICLFLYNTDNKYIIR